MYKYQAPGTCCGWIVGSRWATIGDSVRLAVMYRINLSEVGYLLFRRSTGPTRYVLLPGVPGIFTARYRYGSGY